MKEQTKEIPAKKFKVKPIKNQKEKVKKKATRKSKGLEVTVHVKLTPVGKLGLLLVKVGAFLISRFGIDARVKK